MDQTKRILQDVLQVLKISDSDSLLNTTSKGVILKTKDGHEIKSFIPAATYIGQLVSQEDFTGVTKEEEASVYQWLEYCLLHMNSKECQEMLTSKMTFQEKESYINVSRWFRQVQSTIDENELYPKIYFTKTRLYT
ncbi:uncharacterized protein LOC118202684 isoform X2 [Stegodyphus dumicola]|uniref:uncharacterized protein LOC118202684 isoform X2 n=1 Tax=Stegodyphus dumicola TaxID=202533 RepID=UPI0015AE51B0|nr:uncharacterized protein LOC118202684 isoform X2 [Stegodyphus dumicola]